MGLFPRHAPTRMALSRLGARTPSSPDPLRFRFSPARCEPGAQLRDAVLQTVQGLLLRKIGQARPPRWPKLGRFVEVPRRLRTTACGAWNCCGESGRGSDRGQPGPPVVTRADFTEFAAGLLWGGLRPFRTPASQRLALPSPCSYTGPLTSPNCRSVARISIRGVVSPCGSACGTSLGLVRCRSQFKEPAAKWRVFKKG